MYILFCILGPQSRGNGCNVSDNEGKTDPDSTTNHLNQCQALPYGWDERSLRNPSPCSNRDSNMKELSPRGNSSNMSPMSFHDSPAMEDKQQVFRVPRGRPPSISNPSTPQPPLEQSTFIKPLPPQDHRFDRAASPLREWDGSPQSSHLSPKRSPHPHHSPRPSSTPNTMRDSSTSTRPPMQANPHNPPSVMQQRQTSANSLQSLSNMYNNQFPQYPTMYNQSNYYPPQINRIGYSEFPSYGTNPQFPTEDSNYGTTPGYQFYEHFSNPMASTSSHRHPFEQFSNVYQNQAESVRSGFKSMKTESNQNTESNCLAEQSHSLKSGSFSDCSNQSIKKEANDNQWPCGSQVYSQQDLRGMNNSQNGQTSGNIKMEVSIKKEKDERLPVQCDIRMNDYPNMFPRQAAPNQLPYPRPPWPPHQIMNPYQHVQVKQEHSQMHPGVIPPPQSYDYQVSLLTSIYKYTSH